MEAEGRNEFNGLVRQLPTGCVAETIGGTACGVAIVVSPSRIAERVCTATNGSTVVSANCRIAKAVCITAVRGTAVASIS